MVDFSRMSISELKAFMDRPDIKHQVEIEGQAIRNFQISVMYAKKSGQETQVKDYAEEYMQINPCIHRKCNDKLPDFRAMTYFLQRLPEEIADVKRIKILKSAPRSDRNGIARQVFSIKPGIRRRQMFLIGGDLLETIARDNETDLYDLTSCIVGLGIEEEKLTKSLSNRGDLKEGLLKSNNMGEDERRLFIAKLADHLDVEYDELMCADKSLDKKLLPFLGRLVDTGNKVSDIRIEYQQSFRKNDIVYSAKQWAENILSEVKRFGNRPVAIISSDDHSATNLLLGRDYEEAVKSYALQNHIELAAAGQYFYALESLCKSPSGCEFFKKRRSLEETLGIKRIIDSTSTGINVQLIDTQKFKNYTKSEMLPNLKSAVDNGLVLLVMDYPFGRQANFIMDHLIERLNKNITSISILGKGGILLPNTPDQTIMLPNEILNAYWPGDFKFRNNLRPEDIGKYSNVNVYSQRPMITVQGTLQQSDLTLAHYLAKYGAFGIDMEAFPYINSISRQMGRNLHEDIKLNIGYWRSDYPFDKNKTLSADHIREGFNTIYVLSAATLERVFELN